MAKITNKFDAYTSYINALVMRLTAEREADAEKIGLLKAIHGIIDKRKNGIRVDSSEYASLARLSCPDYDSLELFHGSASDTDDPFSSNPEKLLFLCPTISCETCWHNYINQIADAINCSSSSVKDLEPIKDDITLTPSADDMKELEAAYLTLQELQDMFDEASGLGKEGSNDSNQNV